MLEYAVGEGTDDGGPSLRAPLVAGPGGGGDHPRMEEGACLPDPESAGEPMSFLKQNGLLLRDGIFDNPPFPPGDGGVRVDHPTDVPAGKSPPSGGGACHSVE